SPFEKNIMSAQRINPAIKLFTGEMDKVANASKEFPLVMTTYSCTEHWCTGGFTRWQPWLVEAQPQAYVEMSEELAKEKGIANGEKVRISSVRGAVEAVAMVTVRLAPFTCGGKTVHQVGMTFNYGWNSPRKDCGDSANLLSPTVGDANSMTPEYKAFMVNIEKIA
ncbi:MAG: molybdopterin dinucleotide binding domain-containing protein, partial [Bilophila sp.]